MDLYIWSYYFYINTLFIKFPTKNAILYCNYYKCITWNRKNFNFFIFWKSKSLKSWNFKVFFYKWINFLRNRFRKSIWFNFRLKTTPLIFFIFKFILFWTLTCIHLMINCQKVWIISGITYIFIFLKHM